MKKFGHLLVVGEQELTKGSMRYADCVCDCGSKHKVRIDHLVNNRTKSCGKCYSNYAKWWDNKKKPTPQHIQSNEIDHEIDHKNKEDLLLAYKEFNTNQIAKHCGISIQTLLKWFKKFNIITGKHYSIPKVEYSLDYLKEYFSGHSITPLEGCHGSSNKIKFLCLCKREFHTRLTDVFNKKIVSCGCVNGAISKAALEIGKLFDNVEYEKSISGFKVDITINNTLAIDYHGLRFHSDRLRERRNDDYDRYNSISKSMNYLVIYEDEWKTKKDVFINIINNKLNANVYKSLRPKECEIKTISYKHVKDLYEKYHYIGKCNAQHHIGVHYGEQLVAALSISKPTRQSKHDWEIVRMVSHPNYKVHGLWSYLMKWITSNNLVSGSIVSFSDNRLSDGNVYKIMGFDFDGDVKPDYSWCKNGKRFHKSSLRKTEAEKLQNKTESELRYVQGYSKIWDCGKIRWIYNS